MNSFANWIVSLAKYCIEPDLVIILDVDCGEAESRRIKRCDEQEVFELSHLQQKLANIYFDFPFMKFQAEGRLTVVPGKIVHVNANRPIDEVLAACVSTINAEEEP